jgi:hypothetical protein
LFDDPQGLPPQRHLSHRIRLKPNAGAVAVHYYCPSHTLHVIFLSDHEGSTCQEKKLVPSNHLNH